MPRISTQEFERLPLRVHTFLAGVALHDVWFVDLPRWRAGVTLNDFLRTANNCLFTPSSLVRLLVGIRFFIGRFFAWDAGPAAVGKESFAARLTDTDRSRSLAAVGVRDGFFRIVYRFENEQLVELINRTVHAAALSTLVETATGYRFYLGVYIRTVSLFTPFYMALIDPFRKWIVYPSLLRSVRARWDQAFDPGGKHNNVNCRCDKDVLPFSQ
jgi:Protein of unknown function (DUF2867)